MRDSLITTDIPLQSRIAFQAGRIGGAVFAVGPDSFRVGHVATCNKGFQPEIIEQYGYVVQLVSVASSEHDSERNRSSCGVSTGSTGGGGKHDTAREGCASFGVLEAAGTSVICFDSGEHELGGG